MGLVRDLATTARAHGAGNLLAPFALVSILIGAPWPVWVLMGLAGILTYMGGCAENSLIDKDRDAKDPLRTQLPLVTGHVTSRQVLWFTVFCQATAILLIGGVAVYRGTWLPFPLIAVAVVASHTYNTRGKTGSRWGALLLFDVATVLPIIAVGLAWTVHWTPALSWLALMLFPAMSSVTLTGDAKDADLNGESNLTRGLGCRIDAGRFISSTAWKVALGVNAGLLILTYVVASYFLSGLVWSQMILALSLLTFGGTSIWLGTSRTWSKKMFTFVCAFGGTFGPLVGVSIVLLWLVGPLWVVLLIAIPLVMNIVLVAGGIGREWNNAVATNWRIHRE